MDQMNEVTRDCFSAIFQLRQVDPNASAAPETIHQRMRSFVDALMRRGPELGIPPQDVSDAAYALVALMDETALSKPEPFRSFWMGNLLQFHFFEENLAGDGFFTRLEAIRNNPSRKSVLRIFYLCLLFGFQGRYRIRGGELELMNLTESLQHELARGPSSDIVLSPSAARPNDSLGGRKRRGPLLAVCAGVVVASLLIYGGLRVAMSSSVSSAAEEMAAWNAETSR